MVADHVIPDDNPVKERFGEMMDGQICYHYFNTDIWAC